MALKETTRVALRRTAGEIKRYRIYKKIIPILMLLCATVLLIGYVISALYMRFGAFTVMVNKFDHINYALTLSEMNDFTTNSSQLNARASQTITNIDGGTIPEWIDNDIGGNHTQDGENFISYTFYCKNAGKVQFSYTYELYIANSSLDIEKAVRVRLYVDGDYTDYAYPRTDGIEGPEPGTTAFQSQTTIVKKRIENFNPGDVTRFTVVIWLEGNDPDCVDKILGGQLKVDMAIEIDAGSIVEVGVDE